MRSYVARPQLISLFIAITLGLGSAPAISASRHSEQKPTGTTVTAWEAEGVELSFETGPEGEARFRLAADRVSLPSGAEQIKDADIECPHGRFSTGGIVCDSLKVKFPHPALDRSAFQAKLDWKPAVSQTNLSLIDIRTAKGSLYADLSLDNNDWKARITGSRLDLPTLQKLAKRFGGIEQDWQLQGALKLRLDLQGTAGEIEGMKWDLKLSGLKFSDPQASYLGEQLVVSGKGSARNRKGDWTGSLDLSVSKGAVLVPVAFIDVSRQPVGISTRFSFTRDGSTIGVESLSYRHPGVLEANADAAIARGDTWMLRSLTLGTTQTKIPRLYEEYLQPVLAETVFERLQSSGDFMASLDYTEGGPIRLVLDLLDAAVADELDTATGGPGQSRFGVRGVNGHLVWVSATQPEDSWLNWAGGQLLTRIELGPGKARMRLSEGAYRLLDELNLPVLDGSLIIDELAYREGESGKAHLDLRAVLTPISMERLSTALDWPLLSGKLSGVIPGIEFKKGSIAIAGNLLLRIFDGQILVRNLSVTDIFGILPALHSDLEIRGLDLETLTSTFAFGRITGKLDGRIDDLNLEGWRPVSFDAWFATPEDDKSRHRISQKAVDNISNLGGAGVSGALSRGFLGIFKDFGYDRLGISCRLKQGICKMGGVAPAAQGYYLVTGRGIPQISIIGYNTETDWERLVDQLVQITEAESPVIK